MNPIMDAGMRTAIAIRPCHSEELVSFRPLKCDGGRLRGNLSLQRQALHLGSSGGARAPAESEPSLSVDKGV